MWIVREPHRDVGFHESEACAKTDLEQEACFISTENTYDTEQLFQNFKIGQFWKPLRTRSLLESPKPILKPSTSHISFKKSAEHR